MNVVEWNENSSVVSEIRVARTDAKMRTLKKIISNIFRLNFYFYLKVKIF